MLPLKNFTHFIEQHHLFERDSKLLVALSGGIDSVALIHLLKAAGYQFAIAHCNFQLRPEADTDEQFCRQIALQHDVVFHSASFNTQYYAGLYKISIQMAARHLRYQWFEQIRQQYQYTCIVLAHHQNDTIETILLNLVRGTGIAGLHGILPKNGHLVRPMLCLTRAEIEKIVAENGLAYVEDSSNASVKYARNKIRHQVVPKLKELNPSLEQTFENNLKHFRELEQLLEIKVKEAKENLFSRHGIEILISIEGLKQLVPQRLLFYKLLQPYGFNETVVDDILASLNKHAGRKFESTSGHLMFLDRDKLSLVKKIDKYDQLFISGNDDVLTYGLFKLQIAHNVDPVIIRNNPLAVSVDSEKLIYPLLLRGWQPNDSFLPLGMTGRKKLSDFFINQKIPLHKKYAVPLLINGNGDVIWVGGYRPDERYKVTQNTKKVTIFELLPVAEDSDTI